MSTKAFALIATALCVYLNAFGQAVPDYGSQVAGTVQVGSVTFEPSAQGQPVSFQFVLKNISPRIILAYTYAIHFHYADGEERSTGGGKDAVTLFIGDPKAEPLFRPGTTETISQSAGFSPPAQAALASISAEITAAVLDDDTAVGDPRVIRGYAASRARDMQQMAGIVGDLKDVRSSQSPRQRALDLAAKARLENPNFQGRARVLTTVADRVEMLDAMISAYEGLVRGLEAHSRLTTAK